MLWCLPCSGRRLVSAKLRDGGPLRDYFLNSSWSKAASGPKQYAMQENERRSTKVIKVDTQLGLHAFKGA
jgi:hypothetical protein